MKIYYKVENNFDCVSPCPMESVNKDNNIFIGSVYCQHCKYCYGYSDNSMALMHDKDKKFLILNQYIKCSRWYTKVPLSVKIQRYFYHLFIKNQKIEIKP